jgi:PAS domain S-box-containing protein
MNTAFNSRALGSRVKRFIHGKAATHMQAGLRIVSPGSEHVPGELHGSASDCASMRLFASIVNLCDDAIISMTIDGVVMTWNNSAERIFGYAAGEMVGQPLARLLRGDGETDLNSHLATLRSGEQIGRYEAIRHCKNGMQIPVCVTCSPVCDTSNQVIGVSEIVREVPSSEQVERVERTNERLKVMGRLASRIAHEINNPLTSVTNLLFLLQKERLTANSAEYVSLAQREVARIGRISAQSLGIYRFSGQPGLCAMADIVDEAVVLCRDRIEATGVAVGRDYRPVSMISCHREELRQVMLNVVRNALDAMPHGGTLRLRIRGCKDWVTSSRGVLITVGDTGRGMTAETRRRLFEPFFTTKDATGTGLGLWTCAHVITKYGGRILVKSNGTESRSGTVFAMFLPI